MLVLAGGPAANSAQIRRKTFVDGNLWLPDFYGLVLPDESFPGKFTTGLLTHRSPGEGAADGVQGLFWVIGGPHWQRTFESAFPLRPGASGVGSKVSNGSKAAFRPCDDLRPVAPRERTSRATIGRSEMGQKETSAPRRAIAILYCSRTPAFLSPSTIVSFSRRNCGLREAA
jgi:hypothetical protein